MLNDMSSLYDEMLRERYYRETRERERALSKVMRKNRKKCSKLSDKQRFELLRKAKEIMENKRK